MPVLIDVHTCSTCTRTQKHACMHAEGGRTQLHCIAQQGTLHTQSCQRRESRHGARPSSCVVFNSALSSAPRPSVDRYETLHIGERFGKSGSMHGQGREHTTTQLLSRRVMLRRAWGAAKGGNTSDMALIGRAVMDNLRPPRAPNPGKHLAPSDSRLTRVFRGRRASLLTFQVSKKSCVRLIFTHIFGCLRFSRIYETKSSEHQQYRAPQVEPVTVSTLSVASDFIERARTASQ